MAIRFVRQNTVPRTLRENRSRIANLERDVGSPWIEVGIDPGAPDFENDWRNVGTASPDDEANAAFYLKGGHTRLRGAITGGDFGTTAFTLPEGYRPSRVCRFLCPLITDDGIVIVKVDVTGEVIPMSVSDDDPLGMDITRIQFRSS